MARPANLLICPHCHRRSKSDVASRQRLQNDQTAKIENGNRQEKEGKEKGDVGKEIDKHKIGKKNGSDGDDPRVSDLGRAIEDDFKLIREKYGMVVPLSSLPDLI